MKKRKLLSALLAASLLCTMAPPATVLAAETNTETVDEQNSTSRGYLTVTGGEENVDYVWQDDNSLFIKTDKTLMISGNTTWLNQRIWIKDNITANLKFVDLTIEDADLLGIGENTTATIECENSTIAANANQGTNLNLLFSGEYNTVENIYSSGTVSFDGENDAQEIGLPSVSLYGTIQADSLVIDGGSYGNGESNIKVDNFTINDGVVSFSERFQTDTLTIHGGYIVGRLPEGYDFSGVAEKYVIDGGTFVGDCDIAHNTVLGWPVVEGKALTYADDNYFGTRYIIIDENELNHYNVLGNKSHYTYNGRLLTLKDGADITVSSDGTVCDQIEVGTPEDSARAKLTLDGASFSGPMAGIKVNEGSSLTLTLKAGSTNSYEYIGGNGDAAIQTENNSVLTINGTGALKAKSAGASAAIGTSSSYTFGAQINIEDGNIEAYTVNRAAAIGGGGGGSNIEINISEGDIIASGSYPEYEALPTGSGIGGGTGSNMTTINISGGKINAQGYEAAAIGSTWNGFRDKIVITGGDITANSSAMGAAIGGGFESADTMIDISGENTCIHATAFSGAAIGGGSGKSTVDSIKISGGEIYAESKTGAGIGSGESSSSVGTIEIKGGTVEAYGSDGADGIGAGKGSIGGKFSTGNGNPVIITNSISDQNSESIWNGVFLVDNMNRGIGKVYGTSVTPTNDFTIPSGKTLEVDAGQSLIVADGITATNNGTVIRDKNGVVDVQGTWLGNPVIVKDGEEGSAVTSVTLDKSTLALQPGTSATLNATVSPATAANKSLRWTSSNTNVATVDANGKVTAVANGTAVITASTVDGGFTAQCTVTVSEDKPEVVAVENVSLDKKTLTVEIGESEKLTATVKPDNAANKNVTWSSNDEDVASVDANGRVTAISRGTATITVRTEDGNFAAQCKVTVTDPDATSTDTETKPDGSTVTTVEDVNGSSSSTTVDANGVVDTSVTLSDSAVSDATKNDTAVILPMVGVTASKDMNTAPSVTVDLPGSTPVQVEIPVLDMTPGTVAVLVDEDGNETILKNSVIGNNGLIVTLSDGDTVKIIDNTQSFGDVAGSYWAKNNIDYVTSRGLFVGVDDSSFAPETPMSRAMIVSVLQRYEGDTTSAAPGENWYEGARQWAIANGVSDGTNMNGNVTREQLVTMLYRYIGSPTMVGSLNSYSDASSVSDYAQQAMVWAVRNGIISGMTADTLAPQGMATRAQVAAILQRFIEWQELA